MSPEEEARIAAARARIKNILLRVSEYNAITFKALEEGIIYYSEDRLKFIENLRTRIVAFLDMESFIERRLEAYVVPIELVDGPINMKVKRLEDVTVLRVVSSDVFEDERGLDEMEVHI